MDFGSNLPWNLLLIFYLHDMKNVTDIPCIEFQLTTATSNDAKDIDGDGAEGSEKTKKKKSRRKKKKGTAA